MFGFLAPIVKGIGSIAGGILGSKGAVSAIGGLASTALQNKYARQGRNRALEDELMKFDRLRDAAEQGGFNPLTAMQYAGQGFGSNLPSGAPPLASAQAIGGAIQDVGDILSGRESQQRAREKLEFDLAKVRLDQATAQVQARGVPVLGARPQQAAPYSSRPSSPGLAAPVVGINPTNTNPLAPGREKEVMPLSNSPGVFEMENRLTYGNITLPGDGEPWGIDELATAVVVGVPQVDANLRKQGSSLGQEADNWVWNQIKSGFTVDPDGIAARAYRFGRKIYDGENITITPPKLQSIQRRAPLHQRPAYTRD